MSYCRFGTDSDIYVYERTEGGIACCGCLLDVRFPYRVFRNVVEFFLHLGAHETKGHAVPVYMYDVNTYDPWPFAE